MKGADCISVAELMQKALIIVSSALHEAKVARGPCEAGCLVCRARLLVLVVLLSPRVLARLALLVAPEVPVGPAGQDLRLGRLPGLFQPSQPEAFGLLVVRVIAQFQCCQPIPN